MQGSSRGYLVGSFSGNVYSSPDEILAGVGSWVGRLQLWQLSV